ncbi:MAG: DUF481 domain-containing protein [Cytophagaceae bacterium]|jgi:hypothetical protein|nr:DUF481 domain-containing protein [Cytophagaceae bacterium]
MKLEYGMLFIDSDGFGKINVKWVDVAKVVTQSPQRIQFEDGKVLIVRLDTLENGTPIIKYADFYELVDFSTIGTMMGIESTFIQRVNGQFNLGLNYVLANNVTTFSVGLNADYINKKSRMALTLSSINTYQKLTDTTNQTSKQTLSFLHNYYFNKRNYWNVQFTAEQNSQLSIKYRGFFGNGIGRTIFVNDLHSFYITAGFGGNLEEGLEDRRRNSIEGLLSAEYRFYKVSTPKFLITFTNNFYPSITISDRYRWSSDLKVDFEIVKNFTVGVSGYYILDTQPFISANNNFDYGLSGTIGIIF